MVLDLMALSEDNEVLEIAELIKDKLFYESHNIDRKICLINVLVIVSLSKDHKTHSIG